MCHFVGFVMGWLIYIQDICIQQMPRSDCTAAQSDEGFCLLFTESLDTVEGKLSVIPLDRK